jgi:hypothetical protein
LKLNRQPFNNAATIRTLLSFDGEFRTTYNEEKP